MAKAPITAGTSLRSNFKKTGGENRQRKIQEHQYSAQGSQHADLHHGPRGKTPCLFLNRISDHYYPPSLRDLFHEKKQPEIPQVADK